MHNQRRLAAVRSLTGFDAAGGRLALRECQRRFQQRVSERRHNREPDQQLVPIAPLEGDVTRLRVYVKGQQTDARTLGSALGVRGRA